MDKRLPMNYRRISLLSCISKLYSNLINKRISKYLEDNDILGEEQNGFRKFRSCEDYIFTLNSIIRNNKQTFATFIDLKKYLILLTEIYCYTNSCYYILMEKFITLSKTCILILAPV